MEMLKTLYPNYYIIVDRFKFDTTVILNNILTYIKKLFTIFSDNLKHITKNQNKEGFCIICQEKCHISTPKL